MRKVVNSAMRALSIRTKAYGFPVRWYMYHRL